MEMSRSSSAADMVPLGSTSEKSKPDLRRIGFWSCSMWALGALFYCYEYYLRVSPSVMTSDLSLAYGVDATALGNLSACYYYAYTIMQIPVGILLDRFGPRYILTFACLSCAIGSYLFAGSDYLVVAGAGRFLVGFGSAFAYVGVLKLTTIWLPPRTFAMFAGFSTALGMFGAISGDLAMTVLVHNLGWKPTVYYSAVAGVILTFVLWFLIRDSAKSEPTFSPKLDSKPANKVSTWKGVWVVCRNPQMWLNGIYGFMTYLVVAAFAEMWGIPYLRDVKHFSPDAAALVNSLTFLGFAIGGPTFGWLSDKIRRRCLPMSIGAAVAAVLITILILMPDLSTTQAATIMFLVGFSASAECLVFAVARDNNIPELIGTAGAFTNMLIMMGGALMQPLVGKLLDVFTSGPTIGGLKVYAAEDYQKAFLILPLCLLIGMVVSLLMKETHCEYKHSLD